jgi:hypothetical protein
MNDRYMEIAAELVDGPPVIQQFEGEMTVADLRMFLSILEEATEQAYDNDQISDDMYMGVMTATYAIRDDLQRSP